MARSVNRGPRYRIISRNKTPWGNMIDDSYYYAQVKVFGFWIDCRFHPLLFDPFDSYDAELKPVENWVNRQILGQSEVKEEVVKTFD